MLQSIVKLFTNYYYYFVTLKKNNNKQNNKKLGHFNINENYQILMKH